MYYLVGSVALAILIFYLYFGHQTVVLFWKGLKLDVKMNYWELAKMKKNGVNIPLLLNNAIKLKENGIDVNIVDLENHQKSGGSINTLVNLLLNAKKNKIELSYTKAALMSLDSEINKG